MRRCAPYNEVERYDGEGYNVLREGQREEI